MFHGHGDVWMLMIRLSLDLKYFVQLRKYHCDKGNSDITWWDDEVFDYTVTGVSRRHPHFAICANMSARKFCAKHIPSI